MPDDRVDYLFKLSRVKRNYDANNRLAFVFEKPEGGEDEVWFVPRGRVIGLLGRSGCGKSTILSLLSLLDRADDGSIEFRPRSNSGAIAIESLYGNHRERSRVVTAHFGHIFQADELLNHLSVEANLQLRPGLRGRCLPRNELEDALSDVQVRRVGNSTGDSFLDKNPADLSEGERTRVGILRALLGEQEVVFADEPTANVDKAAELGILRLLASWTEAGDGERTVLLSTHRINLAWEYADYFIVLNEKQRGNGRIMVRHFHKRGSVGAQTAWSAPVESVEELQGHILESDAKTRSSDQPAITSRLHSREYYRRAAPCRSSHVWWRLLLRDFWKHPRSNTSFLVERLTPLVYVLSFIVLFGFGGIVLGMMAGSEEQYEKNVTNPYLWTTEMRGSATQMEALSESTIRDLPAITSYNGFSRWPVECYVMGTDDFSTLKGRRLLVGHTIEDRDPLLDAIEESLVWPLDEAHRRSAAFVFRNAGFGIIVSADVLEERLGYRRGDYPEKLAIVLQNRWQFWMPVLGVAAQLPSGADFLLNMSMNEAFMSPGFGRQLRASEFVLRVTAAALGHHATDEDELAVQEELERWLIASDIGFGSSEWRTLRHDRSLVVSLDRDWDEFELENRLRKSSSEVGHLLSRIDFPKQVPPARSDRGQLYNRWSVAFAQELGLVREVVREAFSRGIDVDTAFEARVVSIVHARKIFTALASLLFCATVFLSIVLLFVSNWYDCSRKVHTVGVMLGVGVVREKLVLAYLMQMYLLLAAVLVLCVGFDLTGLNARIAGGIGWLVFRGADDFSYTPFSPAWWLFIAVASVVVPVAISLLRDIMLRSEPAQLMRGK